MVVLEDRWKIDNSRRKKKTNVLMMEDDSLNYILLEMGKCKPRNFEARLCSTINSSALTPIHVEG